MTLPWPLITDPDGALNVQAVQENFDAIGTGPGAVLEKLVFFGSGAPGFTPAGPALYVRADGGAGSTLYVFEAGSWVGK